MMELMIEPEFRDKIPQLSSDELSRLEANILEDGEVREPLVVWGNTIIDGHNRWQIIQKHPEVPYKVKQMDFPDKWAAIAWMCRNQLGRRNLSDEQKSYLRGKQYDAEKMAVTNAAGVNQYSEVGGQNVRQPKTRREQQDGTAGRIGKENGVDGRTIRRDADFSSGLDAAETASPGIKEAVLSGEVKAPKSVIAMIRNIPDEQKKEAADAIKRGDISTAKEIVKPKVLDSPTPPVAEPNPESTDTAAENDGLTIAELRELIDSTFETMGFALHQHLVDTCHFHLLESQECRDSVMEALKIGISTIQEYMKLVRGVKDRAK